MTKPTSKLVAWAGATALISALSACGGGSDGPVVLTQVPDSAGASNEAYTSFAGSLGPGDDTAEPLSLGAVTPPTSETDEPAALS
ncbi:MAG: hypothetical protein ABI574_13110 [Burkholderiales bacterium]